MDRLQQQEMFVQKVGTSGPLVRSPTNGRASRASLPKPANSEPVTIRPYGLRFRFPVSISPFILHPSNFILLVPP
jgi:hypothetical protein